VSIRKRQEGEVTVLYAGGNFFGDGDTDDLQQAILSEAASGNQRLVINLTECEAMNSIAIGVLMRAFTNYRSRRGDIRLCGMSRRLVDLFTMTKLVNVFGHYGTESEAIASFSS
jgi:anti-sigma B factor antagonist